MTVEAKGKPPGPSRREGREGNSLCVAASEAALDVSRSVKLGSCMFFSFSRVSCVCAVASGVSDSGQPCGPSPTRLLCRGFCRQEQCNGSPCPPPGDLPNPGPEPASRVSRALQAGSPPPLPPGKRLTSTTNRHAH